MKRIDEYIADLLYDHDCVILPGFGGFITNYAPAKIHPRQHTLTPPGKDILFNVRLQRNDGILANYIADKEDIPYQEAIDQILVFVDSCYTLLQNNNELNFEKIGTFVRNEEGNLEFTPSHQVNFLNESYGMTVVISPPVKRDPENRRPIEAVRPSKENQPLSAKKVAVRTTFIIMPFLLLSLWGFYNSPLLKDIYTNYSGIIPLIRTASTTESPAEAEESFTKPPAENPVETTSVVQQPSPEETQPLDQPASPEETGTSSPPQPGNNTVESDPHSLPAEAPKVEITANTDQYYIIAGAFREIRNAEALVEKLRQKGYQAQLAGLSKSGLQMVTFGTYSGKEEAIQALSTIKQQENPGAWMLRK
jgi:cell division protein FtsN/nucleoid DNA-binding protein